MTATIEAPTDLVARPTTVLYRSARTDLRLVKKRRHPIRDPHTGELVGVTDGQVIAFIGGAFECPLEGMVRLRDTSDAGVCELPAEEVMAWLAKHHLNGNAHEGFWKVDIAAPAPSQGELDRLMEAAWDEELLLSIIEQERGGWDRQPILHAAEGALERLREVKRQAEEGAQQEAQERQQAEARARAEGERAATEKAKAKAKADEQK